VYLIAFLSCHTPGPRRNGTAPGPIYGLAVLCQPASHVLEPRNKFRLYRSVGPWAYIQQKIRVRPGGVHQVLNKLASALEVLVVLVISPRMVHRLAGLERQGPNFRVFVELGRLLPRQILLEHLEVLAGKWPSMMIISDQHR